MVVAILNTHSIKPVVDTLVIGAGIVGLSTALALKDEGIDFLCVDVTSPGKRQSGGIGRTFRHSHKNPLLINYAIEARKGWEQWEKRFNQKLLHQKGIVHIGSSQSVELLYEHDVKLTQSDSSEFSKRLGVEKTWQTSGYIDVQGGMIETVRTIKSLVEEIGSQNLFQTEVLSITINNSGSVNVATSNGDVVCRKIIVCAGTETDNIANLLSVSIPVVKQLHGRYTLRQTKNSHNHNFGGAFVDSSSEHGVSVYGGFVSDRLMVLGLSGSDQKLFETRSYNQNQEVLEYAAKVFPTWNVIGLRRCVTTIVDKQDPDMFGLWYEGPVTFFAGHNVFKFAPVLGSLIAQKSGLSKKPKFELVDDLLSFE